MTFNINALTAHSWLVKNESNLIGLILHDRTNNCFTFMNPKKKKIYPNKEEIEKVYGELPVSELVTTIKDIIYPIAHPDAVLISSVPYPTYLDCYIPRAAGYWCILSNKGAWTTKLCPKTKTLAKYSHEGPFLTEIDARRARLRLVLEHGSTASS